MRLVRLPDGTYDLAINEAEARFETDEGFETDVIASLETDAPATPEELALAGIAPDQNRGTAINSYPEFEGDLLGSKLWLLARALKVDEALDRASQFVREALQHFIDDGRAVDVDVDSLWWRDTGHLVSLIEITRLDGTKWRGHWDATVGRLLST